MGCDRATAQHIVAHFGSKSSYMQKNQCDYQDLGTDYFDRLRADGLKRYASSSDRVSYLVKRLEGLGHKVTLLPQDAA